MKALWLSGGKDSVACLFLNIDRIRDIHVLWVNTGKYLPEHLEWIGRLRNLCPNWHEVRTDKEAQNERNGLPADVLPVLSTNFGAMATGTEPRVKLQSQIQCCFENISGPLWAKTKELGCTTAIVGQRNGEKYKAPRKHGDVIDGVTFEHPIEDWDDFQVMGYVKTMIETPEFYSLGRTSLDCYDCTAYLGESIDWAAYMKVKHPRKYDELVIRLKIVNAAVGYEMKAMEKILEASRV